MKSSLEHKTIRPGSLSDYSFYYSDRRPVGNAAVVAAVKPEPKKGVSKRLLFVVAVLLVAGAGLVSAMQSHKADSSTNSPSSTPIVANKKSAQPAKAAVVTAVKDNCKGNTEDQFIKISISKRHLWACQGGKTLYDSVVITGMEAHESTLTPVGTYHIYAKAADVTLTGADETGSWRDPVSYWMPFLDNQYGTYGFHDATWRQPSEFGSVDPNSDKASHGCVELPLTTSKWLYGWAQVGTTVGVES